MMHFNKHKQHKGTKEKIKITLVFSDVIIMNILVVYFSDIFLFIDIHTHTYDGIILYISSLTYLFPCHFGSKHPAVSIPQWTPCNKHLQWASMVSTYSSTWSEHPWWAPHNKHLQWAAHSEHPAVSTYSEHLWWTPAVVLAVSTPQLMPCKSTCIEHPAVSTCNEHFTVNTLQ